MFHLLPFLSIRTNKGNVPFPFPFPFRFRVCGSNGPAPDSQGEVGGDKETSWRHCSRTSLAAAKLAAEGEPEDAEDGGRSELEPRVQWILGLFLCLDLFQSSSGLPSLRSFLSLALLLSYPPFLGLEAHIQGGAGAGGKVDDLDL